MKMLSIIMVSYNEKEYIEEAIQACLHQNGIEEIEIIIGDDGSSDGSSSVIEDFSREYPDTIKYFIMDRNPNEKIVPSVRVSNVIKRAISYAEGKYFLITSADDVIIGDNRLVSQIQLLNNQPNICAVYCDYKIFWPDQTEKYLKVSSSLSRKVFWGCHYVHISCFVFRRCVIDNLLETLCDDTGVLFSILKTGKVKHMDLVGFAYRQRDKSIVHEADKMELAILELLLYQDVLNSGGFRISSLSRFSKPLDFVYKNREFLKNTKYEKYKEIGRKKGNDILSEMKELDDRVFKKIYYWILIRWALILRLFFRLCRKVEKAI